jgi:hypothetical protein
VRLLVVDSEAFIFCSDYSSAQRHKTQIYRKVFIIDEHKFFNPCLAKKK